MKEYRHRKLWATDHHAAVLESVGTSLTPPSTTQVVKDSISIALDLNRKNAQTMLSTLRREGLIGMNDNGGHFLTSTGFDYLTNELFDKPLPTYAERPGSRRHNKK